jgi:hypothetical protein
MLFVVVRYVDGDLATPQTAAFTSLDTASECFEESAYVVRNGPDDGPGDDPTIVCTCYLYAVETEDLFAAQRMALNGQGILMEKEA